MAIFNPTFNMVSINRGLQPYNYFSSRTNSMNIRNNKKLIISVLYLNFAKTFDRNLSTTCSQKSETLIERKSSLVDLVWSDQPKTMCANWRNCIYPQGNDYRSPSRFHSGTTTISSSHQCPPWNVVDHQQLRLGWQFPHLYLFEGTPTWCSNKKKRNLAAKTQCKRIGYSWLCSALRGTGKPFSGRNYYLESTLSGIKDLWYRTSIPGTKNVPDGKRKPSAYSPKPDGTLLLDTSFSQSWTHVKDTWYQPQVTHRRLGCPPNRIWNNLTEFRRFQRNGLSATPEATQGDWWNSNSRVTARLWRLGSFFDVVPLVGSHCQSFRPIFAP